MIKGLPRPLLWTDKKSMEEFAYDDILNLTLQEICSELPVFMSFARVEDVWLFNEVYYQLTRIYYENPQPSDYQRYADDIKSRLRWGLSDNLVMTIIYHIIRLRFEVQFITYSFVNCIYEKNCKNQFWEMFASLKKYTDTRVVTDYPLRPCPVPPKKLEGLFLNWRDITQDYNKEIIDEVLELWDREKDRKIVAKMIYGSLKTDNSYNLYNEELKQQVIESQKQNELSRKQIQEMEKQIQALNDKLGKETVPLSVLADGLKDYAEEADINEAYDLFSQLNNVLYGIPAWTKNVPELKKFFRKARKDMEKGNIVQGDYVLTKNVENEVNGVASGATGINVNKKGE